MIKKYIAIVTEYNDVYDVVYVNGKNRNNAIEKIINEYNQRGLYIGGFDDKNNFIPNNKWDLFLVDPKMMTNL